MSCPVKHFYSNHWADSVRHVPSKINQSQLIHFPSWKSTIHLWRANVALNLHKKFAVSSNLSIVSLPPSPHPCFKTHLYPQKKSSNCRPSDTKLIMALVKLDRINQTKKRREKRREKATKEKHLCEVADLVQKPPEKISQPFNLVCFFWASPPLDRNTIYRLVHFHHFGTLGTLKNGFQLFSHPFGSVTSPSLTTSLNGVRLEVIARIVWFLLGYLTNLHTGRMDTTSKNIGAE